MNTKRIFIVLIIVFALGVVSGYFFGGRNKSESGKSVTINNTSEKKATNALLKLDLLKDYTGFILSPSETIGNSEEYANNMAEKVKKINDTEITSKFYATGETENKEQKIIDFLNFLNDSIKADLQ
jgi:hypothetical protein